MKQIPVNVFQFLSVLFHQTSFEKLNFCYEEYDLINTIYPVPMQKYTNTLMQVHVQFFCVCKVMHPYNIVKHFQKTRHTFFENLKCNFSNTNILTSYCKHIWYLYCLHRISSKKVFYVENMILKLTWGGGHYLWVVSVLVIVQQL